MNGRLVGLHALRERRRKIGVGFCVMS